MNVSPGIDTSIVVKYNDYNRNLVINPKTFAASGVNTTTNELTITNHGYKTGDKVIHTVGVASAVPGGLTDNDIYYIVRIDDNTFKLSPTYHESTESKPPIVGITSAGDGGTINPLNPRPYYERGVALRDSGDKEAAIRDFTKATELEEEDKIKGLDICITTSAKNNQRLHTANDI